MRIDAPLRHGVESALGLVDDCFEALVVEEAELRVGDEAADLQDLVCGRV